MSEVGAQLEEDTRVVRGLTLSVMLLHNNTKKFMNQPFLWITILVNLELKKNKEDTIFLSLWIFDKELTRALERQTY